MKYLLNKISGDIFLRYGLIFVLAYSLVLLPIYDMASMKLSFIKEHIPIGLMILTLILPIVLAYMLPCFVKGSKIFRICLIGIISLITILSYALLMSWCVRNKVSSLPLNAALRDNQISKIIASIGFPAVYDPHAKVFYIPRSESNEKRLIEIVRIEVEGESIKHGVSTNQ